MTRDKKRLSGVWAENGRKVAETLLISRCGLDGEENCADSEKLQQYAASLHVASDH